MVFCKRFGDCFTIELVVALIGSDLSSFTSILLSDESLFDVGDSSSSKFGTILNNEKQTQRKNLFSNEMSKTKAFNQIIMEIPLTLIN